MKKTFLLIGLVLFTFKSFGQNKRIEYGVKGGLNYSNFIDNNDSDRPANYKGKIGFHLGGFLKINISEKFSLKPELIYSIQGSDFTIGGSGLRNIFGNQDGIVVAKIDGQINESLILIPIIFQYNLKEKISLEIGPQFGYSLNREIEYDNNRLGIGLLRNDDSKKFELGIGLGFGYSLSDVLGVSLRYNYGIIERQNLNTSVFQLGINYKL